MPLSLTVSALLYGSEPTDASFFANRRPGHLRSIRRELETHQRRLDRMRERVATAAERYTLRPSAGSIILINPETRRYVRVLSPFGFLPGRPGHDALWELCLDEDGNADARARAHETTLAATLHHLDLEREAAERGISLIDQTLAEVQR